MTDLDVNRIRGIVKRISEGEAPPFEELKAYGLWDRWCDACWRALAQCVEPGVPAVEVIEHSVLGYKFEILRLQLFNNT